MQITELLSTSRQTAGLLPSDLEPSLVWTVAPDRRALGTNHGFSYVDIILLLSFELPAQIGAARGKIDEVVLCPCDPWSEVQLR